MVHFLRVILHNAEAMFEYMQVTTSFQSASIVMSLLTIHLQGTDSSNMEAIWKHGEVPGLRQCFKRILQQRVVQQVLTGPTDDPGSQADTDGDPEIVS